MDNSKYEPYLGEGSPAPDTRAGEQGALARIAEEAKEKLGLRRLPTPSFLLLLALIAGLALFTLWNYSSGGGTPSLFSPAQPALTSTDEGLTEQQADSMIEAPATTIFVYVSGAVQQPGVYELPPQTRGIDAIEAAGGLRDSAAHEALNLAAALEDGTQIHVLTKKEARQQGSSATAASGGSAPPNAGVSAKVNLNTADNATLQTLPGIGPATAEKILADREKNGPYTSLEDLMRVSGIGVKRVEALEGLATVR